jgi:hypothetical protein
MVKHHNFKIMIYYRYLWDFSIVFFIIEINDKKDLCKV